MKKIIIIIVFLLMLAFIMCSCNPDTNKSDPTSKGEITGITEKYDMYYKSDEIRKIIKNTITDENIKEMLNFTLKKFKEYPEYKYIAIDDLKYDLNDYYVSLVLSVETLNKGEYSKNNQYYHSILIPIYINNKVTDSFLIYYDFQQNKYILSKHFSYRVYREDAEYTPIFDFVSPKEKMEKLVKEKLGDEVEIYKQYLIIGDPMPNHQGKQEDDIYVETSKGACVFVSISCTYPLNEIKNNTLYTIDEYNTSVMPKLYPKQPKTIKWYIIVPLVFIILIIIDVLMTKARIRRKQRTTIKSLR